MNRGLWIARKNYLRCLVTKVSELSGGDSPEFLKEHFEQLLEMHADEKIEEAIACYLLLLEDLKK